MQIELFFGVYGTIIFQSILTFVVADDAGGLALPPRDQFKVYGGYWLAIGLLLLAIFAAGLASNKHHYAAVFREEGVWLEPQHQTDQRPIQRQQQNQPESSADIFFTQQ